MHSFLSSLKKKEAKSKVRRQRLDERSADPITFFAFSEDLDVGAWVGEYYLCMWVWTILQWNLMARSISIDPLALHNILSVSEDHFVFKHDSIKSDKKSVKLHKKSAYCNPLDPTVCVGVLWVSWQIFRVWFSATILWLAAFPQNWWVSWRSFRSCMTISTTILWPAAFRRVYSHVLHMCIVVVVSYDSFA